MSVFCTECGGKIGSKDKFCAACGLSTKQSKEWADDQLKNFVDFLGMEEFAVQTIDVDWKNQFTGPISLSVSKFYYPPKPQHIRYCMNCDNRLARIGWRCGDDDKYICSECILDILEKRVSWVVPLTTEEFLSDNNSVKGCAIPRGDGRHLHIDGINRVMKKDKRLKCSFCRDKTSGSEMKIFNKGDEVFAVSCNLRGYGILPSTVCTECFWEQLSDDKILKKSKGLKQILKLKTRED